MNKNGKGNLKNAKHPQRYPHILIEKTQYIFILHIKKVKDCFDGIHV